MIFYRKLSLLVGLMLLCVFGTQAQTLREQLAAHPERTAGIYHSYEYRPAEVTPAPEGSEPFYISHYGRHGSRRHTSEPLYKNTLTLFQQAAAAGALTAQGRDLLSRLTTIEEDARNRYGDLTPRGVAEHRGIAERMYAAYPTVFSTRRGRECLIESRSTLVPRCILSMAAFNERLKELDPALRMTRESSSRYVAYLSHSTESAAQHHAGYVVADSMLASRIQPRRLIASLFSDEQFIAQSVKDPVVLMNDLYELASIAQDVSYLNISLYDLFTDDELYDLWECENARRYFAYGPSLRFGDAKMADAKPLLRNIVETAQEVIDGKRSVAASLRFGHDSNIIPLLALMGVEGASARVWTADEVAAVWKDFDVTPMGVNLQLIFYRNPKTAEVRVKVLRNEREAVLPIAGGPYYPWEVFRGYCQTLYE